MWVLFGGLALAILLAAVFEIDQGVRAQGQVIPEERTQVIQAADGGVLQSLMVFSSRCWHSASPPGVSSPSCPSSGRCRLPS
jgi:hypothetical protein